MKCNNLIKKLNRYLTNKFDIYPEMGCDKEAEYCIKETAEAIFKEIDITPKDKPDSEGWWWYKYPNCDHITIARVYCPEDGNMRYATAAMLWEDNEPTYILKMTGKWYKAILPDFIEQLKQKYGVD